MMAIVHDDDIFEAISEDDAPAVKVNVIDDIWLEIISGENVIGCLKLGQKTSQSYEAHIHILPKYRAESKEAGDALWKWMSENLSGVIYVTVPVFCENVLNYLRSLDFKVTGRIPQAWLKNNEIHDLVIMAKGV